MLIKRIKPWWMGKRCHPTLTAFIPTTPFQVQKGVKIFWRKSCRWWFWEVWEKRRDFPMFEASLSKELKPGRLHGGRFSCEGWWAMTPTQCHLCPAGKGVHRQHRAQVPSKDIVLPNSCLPSHHYQAGLIFLPQNIFGNDKLWVNTILLIPKWGFGLQKGHTASNTQVP